MIFSTKRDPNTCSVKPGSSLHSWHEKTKKYINDKRYILKLGFAALLAKYGVMAKVKTILSLVFNIVGTGVVIWYCFNFKNFVSYGLMSALLIYYFNLIVDKIKQPYKKEE